MKIVKFKKAILGKYVITNTLKSEDTCDYMCYVCLRFDFCRHFDFLPKGFIDKTIKL